MCSKRWFGMLTCALAVAMGAESKAGEGMPEKNSGAIVLLANLGVTSDEIQRSEEWTLDVNRTVRVVGGDPEWVTIEATSAEMRSFVQNVTVALGLWDNVPTARLRFAIGGFRTISDTVDRDGLNVASLAGGNYQAGGEGYCLLGKGDGDLPEIVEFDTILRRGLATITAQAVMVQEIGHGLGFNHSYLTRSAVAGLTGVTSPNSLMAYGPGSATVMNAGALNPDDVAVASRLYYNPFRPLSRATGTVRGRVLDAAGAKDLYGANVLLVSRDTGRAIVNRFSGFDTSHPSAAAKQGRFALDGVPPGNYDVLVAARDDALVATGGAMVHYSELRVDGSSNWPGALDSFASGFSRGWVRNVAVTAGETVDVGYVRAGEDRSIDRPSRIDVLVRAGVNTYSKYRYEFWSGGKLVHRSSDQLTSTYATRLAPGAHVVKVYGFDQLAVGVGLWELVRQWTLTVEARPMSVTWGRALRSTGRSADFALLPEAYRYTVEMRNDSGKLAAIGGVHGNRWTGYRMPGNHWFRVLAQWSSNEPTFVQQDWIQVSVP